MDLAIGYRGLNLSTGNGARGVAPHRSKGSIVFLLRALSAELEPRSRETLETD